MGKSVGRVVTRVFVSLLVVAVLFAGTIAFINRQAIRDHFSAEEFHASEQIEVLTERMQLTRSGHRVFFASHPTLDASQKFNEQCSKVDHSEEGHVLGCYVDGQIHLFDIRDERLDGIIEVTAVHELLHATFGRLSPNERSSLAEKLTEVYEELALEDPALEQRMSVYAGLSKMSFANELHSVLGTEVRDLPEWLEEHYAQWVEDRAAILDYFDNYHSVFNELKLRSQELQETMAVLRADVEARSAAYDAAVEQFNSDWQEFVQRNQNFEFSSDPDLFYSIRDEFYARRDLLGEEMRNLNADIERYDEMRNELLQLSELNHELEQQLDSELAPPSSSLTEEV